MNYVTHSSHITRYTSGIYLQSISPEGRRGKRLRGKRLHFTQLYENVSDDRRTFDRWLKANAIIGLIFAAGVIAMAVAGYNSGGARDGAVAENTKTTPDVVASERRRLRAGVRNVQYKHE